jgi:esterase/lipase superfamily enzyme
MVRAIAKSIAFVCFGLIQTTSAYPGFFDDITRLSVPTLNQPIANGPPKFPDKCSGQVANLSVPQFKLVCRKLFPKDALQSSAAVSQQADSLGDCSAQCLSNSKCAAFSFDLNSSSGSRSCLLYETVGVSGLATDWITGIRDSHAGSSVPPVPPTVTISPPASNALIVLSASKAAAQIKFPPLNDPQCCTIDHATAKPPSDTKALPLPSDIKKLQPVFFATDRVIKDEPFKLTSVTNDRSMQMTYGLTVISVPKNHIFGNVDRPKFKWLTMSLEKETDADHFRIQSAELFQRDKFVDRLKSDADSVMLFVHGYNVPFEDALFRAAQIAYDSNYGGTVLVFSWPSAGALLGYDYDSVSAEFASGDLLQILRMVSEEIGAKKFYIVAHSLGNEVLVNALQQAALSKVPLDISELVMAAPDVSTDVFAKKADQIRSVTKNLTMYASAADKALLASDKKTWGKRLGYVNPDGPNLFPGLETIDVTAVGDDMFSLDHSTFATSRAVLTDLASLLQSASHIAPDIRTPTLRFVPDKDHVQYWLYPR